MPIYQDGERLISGIDQGADHIGSLEVAGERGNIEVRYGRLTDGVLSPGIVEDIFKGRQAEDVTVGRVPGRGVGVVGASVSCG